MDQLIIVLAIIVILLAIFYIIRAEHLGYYDVLHQQMQSQQF